MIGQPDILHFDMEDTITTTMKGSLLAFTDDSVLSINTISTAVSELGIQGVEQCDPKIITQASSFEYVSLSLASFGFCNSDLCAIHISIDVNIGESIES